MRTDQPGLGEARRFARTGDTLIVWQFDRLSRFLKQMIETIATFKNAA